MKTQITRDDMRRGEIHLHARPLLLGWGAEILEDEAELINVTVSGHPRPPQQ